MTRFDVPLLSNHKILGRLPSPSTYEYSRLYFAERGVFFSVPTSCGSIQFIHTSADDLLRSTIPTELRALIRWALEAGQFPSSGGFRRNEKNLSKLQYKMWVRMPDGTWYVGSDVSSESGPATYLYTPDTNGKAQLISRHPSMLSADGRTNSDLWHAITETLTSFTPKFDKGFKRSRAQWRKEQRASGAMQAMEDAAERQRQLDQETTRKAVLTHGRELIAILGAHLISVEEGVITLESCRAVFDAQNEMTSLNAKLKAAYGVK